MGHTQGEKQLGTVELLVHDSVNGTVHDTTPPNVSVPITMDFDTVTLTPVPGDFPDLENGTDTQSRVFDETGTTAYLFEATMIEGTDVNFTAVAFDVVGVSENTFSCVTPNGELAENLTAPWLTSVDPAVVVENKQ